MWAGAAGPIGREHMSISVRPHERNLIFKCIYMSIEVT